MYVIEMVLIDSLSFNYNYNSINLTESLKIK